MATFIVPITVASTARADATITKTFTVTNPNGTPYAGALVQIYYWDGHDNYPSPTVTDSSGHASITIPYAENFIQWEVEPKAGDTSNAIVAADNSNGEIGQNSYKNENVAVQFKPANMKISLYLADGTTAAPINYSAVAVPYNGNHLGLWLLRQGPVGINIPNDLDQNTPNYLGVNWNTDATDNNEIPTHYGLQINGSSGQETFGLFTDKTDSTVYQADGQGIYPLLLQKGNIQGQVRTNNGGALSIPSDGLSMVSISSLNQDGSINREISQTGISSNGTFYANLTGVAAGKYLMDIQIANSKTLPFFEEYLWVNSSGNFSLTQNGTYGAGTTTSPFTFSVNAPQPNFVFNFVKGDGTTTDSGSMNIWGVGSDNGNYNINYTTIGQGSVYLPDGQYQFNTNPNSPLEASSQYAMTVTNGVSSVSQIIGNSTLSPDGSGAFTLISHTANFRVQTVDPSSNAPIFNAPVNIYLRNCNGSNCNVSNTQTDPYTGISSNYLPQGSYTFQAWNSPDYGVVSRNVDVDSSGNVTFSGYTYSSTYSAYIVALPLANFKFYMPGGHTNGQYNEWYEICTGTDVTNTGSCVGNGTDSSFIAGSTLAPGNYILKVHPYSDTLAVSWWNVNVASDGTVTVPNATKNGQGEWVVPGAAANVNFLMENPNDNSPITNGYIWVNKDSGGGNFNINYPNLDVGSDFPGITQGNLPDGTYRLGVNAGDQSLNLATRYYQLVMNQDVPTLTYNGQPVATSNGRYVIAPSNSNFTFKMVDPTNSNAVITDGWLDLCQDTGNGPTQTGPCNGGNIDNQTGVGNLNVPTGNWYIRVNPGPNEVASSATYSISVDSSGNVTSNQLSAPSGSNPWTIPAGTPNVTGHFLDSNTHQPLAINPQSNQGVNINLQSMDTNGNWQWIGNGAWRPSNSFAMTITSANDIFGTHHFRVIAQPQNLGNYSDSYSQEFYLTSGGKLSLVSSSDSGATSNLSGLDINMKTPNLYLEVKNPIDNSDLPGGWVTIFKVDPSGVVQDQWIGNANLSNTGSGLANAYLADGTYRLEVNPQIGSSLISGLSLNRYQAVVSNNGASVVVTHFGDNTNVSKSGSNFVLMAGEANVTGRLTASDGSTLIPDQNKWINLNVQQQDTNGNWQYSQNWYNTDQNGNFSISVNTPGIYRLLLQPNGFSNAATTYSSTFTVTQSNMSTFKEAFGTIALQAPDLILQVVEGSSPTPVQNININVQQNNQQISNAYTGPGAVASISFPAAGTYQLQLYPDSTAIQNGYTQKTYTATVTTNNNGSKSVVFATDPGVGTGTNGAVTLALGAANIAGTVTLPNSDTSVANSQVIPYDSNGNGLWQYTVSTSQNGTWAMSLPVGTYTIQAQAPYGNSTIGASSRLGTITVTSNGVSLTNNLSNQTATHIAIPLKNPTWMGVVEAPSPNSTPVPYAQVCLNVANTWNCTQANATGAWAMSAPNGFSSFDSSSQLQVQDVQGHQYANINFQGSSAVSQALGGLTSPSVVLHLATPNLQVGVNAGNQPAANININLIKASDNSWLGNAQTDASGVANFNVQNLNDNYILQADPASNPALASNYAFTVQPLSATSNSTESVTVNLATPNFLGEVHAQSSGSTLGATIPNEEVELDSMDGNGNTQWIGSTGTDSQGNFAFYAAPTYGSTFMVRVHANQGGLTNGTDSSYVLTLTNGSIQSVNLFGTSTPAPSRTVGSQTFYDLSLLAPSVSGVVKDSNGNAILNSWVQPFNVNTREWLQSPNTDSTGAFGLALPTGTYQLQANPPWNSSGNAKSSICQVSVAGGTISGTPSAACNASNGAIQLQLHAPNLVFTLHSGSTPIVNANVNVQIGAWNTWANSDSNGLVSLYVDAGDIALLNPTLSGSQQLNFWFNPQPSQSNLMVQSSCHSGQSGTLCAAIPNVTIGTPFSVGSPLGTLQVSPPNTQLQIRTPNGLAAGAGYWITLESFDTGTAQNFRYLGGASTDASGIAYFNIDTSTATASTVYGVIINPSGADASSYATGYVGDYQQSGDWLHGLTWTQLVNSTNLKPKTPNLTMTVTGGDGAVPDRYGWINILQLDQNGHGYGGWGSGLNYNGTGSAFLPASSNFTITSYPNGVPGAPTSCNMSTNDSGVVTVTSGSCSGSGTSIALTLSLGNVFGIMEGSDGTPISGAIVVAQIGSDTSTAVTTATSKNGAFGFNIDATKNYTIIAIAPLGSSYPNKSIPFTPQSSANAVIDLKSIEFGG